MKANRTAHFFETDFIVFHSFLNLPRTQLFHSHLIHTGAQYIKRFINWTKSNKFGYFQDGSHDYTTGKNNINVDSDHDFIDH